MGNFLGAVSGVFFSGGLLGGLTAAAYYVFCLWRGIRLHPPTLGALIAVVLLVSWLIGWAISEDPRVGQISQELYDASNDLTRPRKWYYDNEYLDTASFTLFGVSFLLPLAQFFCGSFYTSTRQLFGAKEP